MGSVRVRLDSWREPGTTLLVWGGLIALLALFQSYYAPARGMTPGLLGLASARFFGNAFLLWSTYSLWASDYFRLPPLHPDRPSLGLLGMNLAYRLGFCVVGGLLAWANATRVQNLLFG